MVSVPVIAQIPLYFVEQINDWSSKVQFNTKRRQFLPQHGAGLFQEGKGLGATLASEWFVAAGAERVDDEVG